MELKYCRISFEGDIIQLKDNFREIHDAMIKEFDIILNNRFLCFKVKEKKRANSYGVSDGKSDKALTEYIEKEDLLKMHLIFVDLKKEKVYFNCSQKTLTKTILLYFKNRFDLIPDVEFSDLEILTKLKIVEKRNKTLSLEEINEFECSKEIQNILATGNTDEISIELKLGAKVKNQLFYRSLETIMKRCATGSKTLTFSGQDKHGNKIKYENHLNKVINIDDDNISSSDWKSIESASFENIANKILEKVD